MKVFSERAADTPLVAISVLARGGAGADPPGREGCAHHIAELAVRGAGELDRHAIDTELDRIGTSLAVNTSRDYIGYTAMCLSRHAARVVEILAEIVARPRFEADEHAKLIRETRSDLEEIRDDDSDLAARFFARFFWPGHPYARAIEGSESSLEQLAATRVSDLAGIYSRAMSRENVVVGVAGSIEDGDAERFAETLTKPLECGVMQPRLVNPSGSPPQRARVYLIEKPDRSQSQVLIGHPAPHYASPDGPALLMVEAAFGGMFSSRLMQEVRVQRGWSYDASIRLARSAAPSWIRMSLAPTAAVTARAIGLVVSLYAELVARGLETDELDLARRFTVGGMLLSRATARQRVQQRCIGAISGLSGDFVAELPARLEALRLDDVNTAITRHLSADNLTIVVVGGEELVPALSELGDVEIISYRDY